MSMTPEISVCGSDTGPVQSITGGATNPLLGAAADFRRRMSACQWLSANQGSWIGGLVALTQSCLRTESHHPYRAE